MSFGMEKRGRAIPMEIRSAVRVGRATGQTHHLRAQYFALTVMLRKEIAQQEITVLHQTLLAIELIGVSCDAALAADGVFDSFGVQFIRENDGVVSGFQIAAKAAVGVGIAQNGHGFAGAVIA